ncbi:MAG: orotate phosphoribosyltransferase [Chloroflexota bacterium]
MIPSDIQARLLRLLRERAVLHGHFTLSSGETSSYYIDARLVTLSGVGSPLVGSAFLDLLGDDAVSAVAGLSIAADPIVASIVTMSGLTDHPIDGLIIRKEPKKHGTGGRIVGPWRQGLRIAIVDDTFTTGNSALEATHVVEGQGGEVCGVFALIDREQGARGAIEAAGYPFTSLFTASDLLKESQPGHSSL